jgi:sec-independent protein translocase protein TatA
MRTIFLFIGTPELFVVFLAVLLLFGSSKIPELARGLGKGMREFKKATEDIKKEITEETKEIRKDFDEIKDKLND